MIALLATLLLWQASQPIVEPEDPLVPIMHCPVDNARCLMRQAMFLYAGWAVRGEIIEFKDRRIAIADSVTSSLQRAYDEAAANGKRGADKLYPDSSGHWVVPVVVGVVVGIALGSFATFEIVTHVRR